MNIPSLLQSSADPEQVSLTVVSLGKAGAGLLTLFGVLGVIDPTLLSSANSAWGNLVASVVTAIPAGYAVWHAGQVAFGIIRKIGMRILALFSPAPAQQ